MSHTSDLSTHVQGIPCGISVTYYSPAMPMRVTGSGFGDAIAPEPEEVEFKVLDRKGYLSPWLEKKLTTQDIARITREITNDRF